jgi:hypothetical protein
LSLPKKFIVETKKVSIRTEVPTTKDKENKKVRLLPDKPKKKIITKNSTSIAKKKPRIEKPREKKIKKPNNMIKYKIIIFYLTDRQETVGPKAWEISGSNLIKNSSTNWKLYKLFKK